MLRLGTSASSLPSQTAAAVLYSLPLYLNGNPANTSISSPLLASMISSRASSHLSRSGLWKKRSPHVYPDTESSGKTRMLTPLSAACRIIPIIMLLLKAGSATLSAGDAAAAFTNPSRIPEW